MSDGIFDEFESIIVDRENSSFEELSSKVKNDLVRWTTVGLIEGIDDGYEQKVLAILFEVAMNCIVDNGLVDELKNEDESIIMIFPIIRRLFVMGKLNSLCFETSSYTEIRNNAKCLLPKLLCDVNKYLASVEVSDIRDLYHNHPRIDYQAELSVSYCECFSVENFGVNDYNVMLTQLKLKLGNIYP